MRKEVTYREKKVIFTVELLPNLVLHILAAGEVGYDLEYGKRYRNTLQPEEKDFLKNHANDFAFHTQNANLRVTCFMLPCYFRADTIENVEEIYNVIIEALKNKSVEPLRKRYPEETGKLRKWLNWGELSYTITNAGDIITDSTSRFKDMLLSYYARFYSKLWKNKKSEIESVKGQIEEFFVDKQIIEMWENLTGLKFVTSYFDVLLCEGNKEIDGISLGYERVIFYSNREINLLIDFIIHEIGAHILTDLYFSPKVQNLANKKPQLFYKLIESSAEYLRAIVLKGFGIEVKRDIVKALHAEKEFNVFKEHYIELKHKGIKEVFLTSLEYLDKRS